MSKLWAHNIRIQEEQTLCRIESEIAAFENDIGGIYTSDDHKIRMVSHYAEREKILKEKEETWRLRSRAIWMLEGDENTKFYHKFANGRKAINTIWQLQNEQGQIVNTFSLLAELASSHFKSTYRAPREINLSGLHNSFPNLWILWKEMN